MTEQDVTTPSRTTIGLTSAGKAALDRVLDANWFSSGDSAFRTAVAFAIAHEIPRTAEGPFETVWNVGTLDRENFRGLVALILGDEQPWEQIQRLGDAGLRVLAKMADDVDVPSEALLSGSP